MDQVDEIKAKIDIVSLIGGYISLKKAGRNFRANCPFHGEKTPSFMVSPELSMYKCFGCQKSGDIFTFLEEYEGMEFREALKYLADKAGVKLTFQGKDDGGEKDKLFTINSSTSQFYHYILLKHPSAKIALDYLTIQRGLTLRTIEDFYLGYSPEAPNVLRNYLVDKKKYQLTEVEKTGTGYLKGSLLVDRFRGRIIFPLFDHRGNLAGFSGRILPQKDQDQAKYINTPETPCYHKSKMLYGLNLAKEEIKKAKEVILVEGELDMISPYQAGVKNVVAIKGSALTDDQISLLGRFTKRIIFALDSDFAGNQAALKGVISAQSAGMEVLVANLGEYKDPDEAVRKDKEFFIKAIKNAVGIWDFIIETIFKRYESLTGGNKLKISREITPILSGIDDKIVQAHYVNLVAKRFGVSEEAVLEQMQVSLGSSKDMQSEILSPVSQGVSKTRKQLLEERLLSICFQNNPKLLKKEGLLGIITSPVTQRLYVEYLKYAEKNDTFSPAEFAKFLPSELAPLFTESILISREAYEENPEELEREVNLIISELNIQSIHDRLRKVTQEITQFEEEGETQKSSKSQKELRELSRKLSRLEEDRKQGIILQEL